MYGYYNDDGDFVKCSSRQEAANVCNMLNRREAVKRARNESPDSMPHAVVRKH